MARSIHIQYPVMIGIWLFVVSASVTAQLPRPVDVADDLRAGAAFTDVYVNDSFAASDAVGRAAALTRRGDWEEAAELLQKTSDAGTGKLVRVAPGNYVGIRDYINRIVARWPNAGLNAYRFLFERRLQTTINELGSRPPIYRLHALVDQYFCTKGAVELADRVAQASIESGDFAAAERICRRMLDLHPTIGEAELRFRAMLGVLTAINGRIEEADLHGQGTVRWMGVERTLRQARKQISDEFTTFSKSAGPRSWPVFGGSPERSRRGTATVSELGLLWRTRIGGPEGLGTGPGGESKSSAQSAGMLTVEPVAQGGLVFIQRFRQIVALKAGTGAIVWRFNADSSRAEEASLLDDQPSGWDAVTVFDGRVYASLPGETLPFYSYESARSPSELVCLDAKTGRTIWRLDQQVIEEDFAEVMFDSSPLVRTGRMFVVGRRRRSFGFEDCYLYGFDSDDGRLLFRTHLGSASTGTFGSRQATRTIAAMHGDSVFVCTNLGTIASVSGTTGSVKWLTLYARAPRDMSSRGGSGRTRLPWHYNPLMWSAGRVLVMPSDANELLILGAIDGKLKHAVTAGSIANMETLLGVDGHILCGAGREIGCFDLMTDEMIWSVPFPDGMVPRGRGVWSGDRLLIPSQRGLSVFEVAGGAHSFTRWDVEGRAGNVLALEHELIVADGFNVSAYVQLSEILSALRERMRVASGDPVPALELAEVSLNNGEYVDAMNALGAGVERAEAQGERLAAQVRQRLFEDALLFAGRLAVRDRLEADTLNTLFDFASQFTPSVVANVTYRFTFAELYEKQGAVARSVSLYQQVLRDRLLRELAIDGADTAGTKAREEIGALIKRYGRVVYAPHELDARAWLKRGRSAGDMAMLERVVESFPNSEAASGAIVAHGDLLAASGEGEAAARRYVQALHRYGDLVDRPIMLRKIADAYESAGLLRQAYRWLGKAAWEHPSVRFEYEGRKVSFGEYRRRLSHVRAQVEPSRPKLRLPLTERFETAFVGSVALLSPRFSDVPGGSWARYFVRTDDGIRAFDARNGAELWPKAAIVEGAADLLHSGTEFALFATAHEVFALDISSGSRRWSYGSRPLGADAPEADWEQGDAFRGFAMYDNRLVALRESGHLICLSADSGKQQWDSRKADRTRRLWFVSESWVVCHGVANDRAEIRVLAVESGALVNTFQLDDRRAIESVFSTIDGQIVVVGSQSVVSYVPETGMRRWQYVLRGRAFAASLQVDVDTLYLSDNGRTIQSLNIETGELRWESQHLATQRHEDLTIATAGSSVIVSSSTSVSGVDAVTGLTLWQGTTPEDSRFVARFLTDAYVVAVDVPDEAPGQSVAYFYDHRNASGLIPRDGGAATLASFTDLRALMATDGGLVVQTGSTIRGWVHP